MRTLSVLDASFERCGCGRACREDDVSFNAHLSVLDASFQNDVAVEGKLVKDDVSFNAH